MKFLAIVLGICLTAVLGLPTQDKSRGLHLVGTTLVQHINDLEAMVEADSGANFTDIKNSLSEIANDINAIRQLTTSLYGINETDNEKPMKELEEIILASTIQHPEIILTLFNDEPLTIQYVQMLVLARSLGFIGDNMERSLTYITDDDIVRDIFGQTVEIEFVVRRLHDLIVDIEMSADSMDDSDNTDSTTNDDNTLTRSKRQYRPNYNRNRYNFNRRNNFRIKTNYNINKRWSVGTKGLTYRNGNFKFNARPTIKFNKFKPRVTGGKVTFSWKWKG